MKSVNVVLPVDVQKGKLIFTSAGTKAVPDRVFVSITSGHTEGHIRKSHLKTALMACINTHGGKVEVHYLVPFLTRTGAPKEGDGIVVKSAPPRGPKTDEICVSIIPVGLVCVADLLAALENTYSAS